MLRNGASRLALRTMTAPVARPAAKFQHASLPSQWTTQFGSMAATRPQTVHWKPTQASILCRNISEKIPKKQKEAEKRYAQETIKPTPETVSLTSSTHPLFSEIGTETPQREIDMMAGLKHDVVSRALATLQSMKAEGLSD